jgi:4-amino-4-deoxy-L-arabinose transferase-like glycosyltransferase
MQRQLSNYALFAAYLGLLLVASLLSRALIPIDETRYTTVAWEMWLRGDWLVPHLNGATYSHKPPLLFWLIQLGWQVFGVNEWWPRIIPFLFAFGTLLVTGALARRLWPSQDVDRYAPFILLGFTLWSFFSSAVMFDMMLSFFVLLAIYAIHHALHGSGWRWWLLLGLAWGLGMLSKGPVVFVHTLPLLLLAGWWSDPALRPDWSRLLSGFLLAFGLSLLVIFAWVVPAILSGGEEYGRSLLLGQNIERALQAPNDALPWWFYLPFLPLILFPWLYWGGTWKALLAGRSTRLLTDSGVRFCVAWVIPVFLLFTLISGKKVHYLLPLLPAISLLLGYLLLRLPAAPGRVSMLPLTLLYLLIALAVGVIGFTFTATDTPYWLQGMSPLGGLALALLALAGLWLVRGDTLRQVRLLGLQTIMLLVLIHVIVFVPMMQGYDLRPIAQQIHELQQRGHALANNGKYHGEFHFLGRLQQPLANVRDHTVAAWMEAHPDGYVIGYRYEPCGDAQQPVTYQRLYRNGQCLTIRSTDQERTHRLLRASQP